MTDQSKANGAKPHQEMISGAYLRNAWYETGPDPVFAQAADRPTRFIRVMILPLAYLGKSSVEYLNEEDKAKPKSQSYKIFADMPLTPAMART